MVYPSPIALETITSVALMIATASLPRFSFSRFADDVLINATTWWPAPMSITTSVITEAAFSETTFPLNWFRALNAMPSPWIRLRSVPKVYSQGIDD
jgi:hypothetical protein